MPAIHRVAVTETSIREHAYHLWEKDGRPFGRDQEFWARAVSELADLVQRRKPARAAAAPKATAKPDAGKTPVAPKAVAAKAAKPAKAAAPTAKAPKVAGKPAKA